MNDIVVLLRQSTVRPVGVGLAVVACKDNPWAPLARWFERKGHSDPLGEAHKYQVQGLYHEATALEGLLLILSYFNGDLEVEGPP